MKYKRRNPLLASRSALLAATLVALTGLPPAFGQEGKEGRTWAFTHPEDSFSAKAVLDLRHLNEKEAGESGFLKLTPDGNAFALGNGKPVRLWAVGSDFYRRGTRQQMARHARFLAKIGVNMVRIHTQPSRTNRSPPSTSSMPICSARNTCSK